MLGAVRIHEKIPAFGEDVGVDIFHKIAGSVIVSGCLWSRVSVLLETSIRAPPGYCSPSGQSSSSPAPNGISASSPRRLRTRPLPLRAACTNKVIESASFGELNPRLSKSFFDSTFAFPPLDLNRRLVNCGVALDKSIRGLMTK